jgi:hypothetical protein
MTRFMRAFWFCADCIFPLPTPFTGDEITEQERNLNALRTECASRVNGLTTDEKELDKYFAECSSRLEDEKARGQGVESRLTSIMGLSSIAGSIVFGSTLALATGTVHVERNILRWVIAGGALYLTVQLCSAVLAAVRGLSRRQYSSESAADILPAVKEASVAYVTRRIGSKTNELVDLQQRNNEKVTQMAVGHRAMINFLVVLVLFSLLGTVYGIRSSGSNGGGETLENDHKLMEMLRGPQGPPGIPGPPGLQGAKGEGCKATSPRVAGPSH